MGTKIFLLFYVVTTVHINCQNSSEQAEQTKSDSNQQSLTSSNVKNNAQEEDTSKESTIDNKNNSLVSKEQTVSSKSLNKTNEEKQKKSILRMPDDGEVDVDIYVSYFNSKDPIGINVLRNDSEPIIPSKSRHLIKQDSQELEPKSNTMTIYFDGDQDSEKNNQQLKKAKKKHKRHKHSKLSTTTDAIPSRNSLTRLKVKHVTKLDPFIVYPQNPVKKKAKTSYTKPTEKSVPDEKIEAKYSYEEETQTKKDNEKVAEQLLTAEQIYKDEDAYKDIDPRYLRHESVTSGKKQTSTEPTEVDMEVESEISKQSEVVHKEPIYEYIYEDVDSKTEKQIEENKKQTTVTTDDDLYKESYAQTETTIVTRGHKTTRHESKKHKTTEPESEYYEDEEPQINVVTTEKLKNSEKFKEESPISKPKEKNTESTDKVEETQQQTSKVQNIKTTMMVAPKIGYNEFLSFLSPFQQDKLRMYLEHKHQRKLSKKKRKKSTKLRVAAKKKSFARNGQENVMRVDVGQENNVKLLESPLDIFYRRITTLNKTAEGVESPSVSISSESNREMKESDDTS